MTVRAGTNASGILVVDKPQGPTSFGVVKKVRAVLKVRKVGHTGTLDPMATGVLPVAVGRATKLVPFLLEGDKEYSGRILLGRTTDTGDITGQIIEEVPSVETDEQAVRNAAARFVGEIEQTAPAYSAVKVDGRPMYRLARAGQEVPEKKRCVTVHEFSITRCEPPELDFYARVSKGTYIRSLAMDLGLALGCGACLSELRRLSAGPFGLDGAITWEELDTLPVEEMAGRMLSMEEALSFLPRVDVSEHQAGWVLNGRPLPIDLLEDFPGRPGPIRVQAQGGLLAIYEYQPQTRPDGETYLRPVRVLGK